MRCAGIDIGSRSIELVVVDQDRIVAERQTDTGFDPLSEVKALLADVPYDRILATGYGRNLFEIAYMTPTVTEIKAYARGVSFLFPGQEAVLDIGGQDSKVIALTRTGRVKKFEMNDRCAAGTGKFLEIMAAALGFSVREFGGEALKGTSDLNISSMCTVFAESEVTSLIAKGEDPREIALGLHRAVVRRATSMLRRVMDGPRSLVFAGGVANNPCIHQLMEDSLGGQVLVPESPQMTGALGAALLAQEMEDHASGGADIRGEKASWGGVDREKY